MNGAALSAERVRHIFRQLLEGLGAAHHAGVIHRDIKPSNTLLDIAVSHQLSAVSQVAAGLRTGVSQSPIVNLQSSMVKIVDFGLAHMLSSQTYVTAAGSIFGTPEYMSPEQARGEEVDHRTDLYSAGVVLYEMLTGRTPFHADTPTATIARILNEEPQDPRKIDKSVDTFLASIALRLMAKQPEDRFASAAEVLAVIDAQRAVRVRSRSRRAVCWAIAAWAAVLGALMVAGLVSSRWHRAGPAPQAPAAQPTPVLEVRHAIESVRIDPDQPHVLHVRRAESSTWAVLYSFPPEVQLYSAALIDVGGEKQAVLAGSLTPMDEKNNVLVLVDADRRERWRQALCQDFEWPDDDFPTRCWPVVYVGAARVSADGPEQAVVVACHPRQYPARVSVLDPTTRECHATFWHIGQITDAHVERNLFGDRDGILAWGVNNKLDGFDRPDPNRTLDWRPGDDLPVTDWDMVPVVMVLDPHPERLAGLGPPRTARLPLKLARPHAYAFVDAGVTGARRKPGPPVTWLPRLTHVDRVQFSDAAVPPSWEFALNRFAPSGPADHEPAQVGGGLYVVNRELLVWRVVPISSENVDPNAGGRLDEAGYRLLWRRLIIDGEYQDLPPVWRST